VNKKEEEKKEMEKKLKNNERFMKEVNEAIKKQETKKYMLENMYISKEEEIKEGVKEGEEGGKKRRKGRNDNGEGGRLKKLMGRSRALSESVHDCPEWISHLALEEMNINSWPLIALAAALASASLDERGQFPLNCDHRFSIDETESPFESSNKPFFSTNFASRLVMLLTICRAISKPPSIILRTLSNVTV
jgi:hypothetical protein